MLSWLASDYFQQSPVLAFPVLALLIFMAVFTAMAYRAFRAPQKELDQLSMLPLGLDGEVMSRVPEEGPTTDSSCGERNDD